MSLSPELRGRFRYGYTPDDFRKLAEVIASDTGVELCCVWEYFDDCGYGGGSEFVIGDQGRFYELVGDLWPWLSADDGCDAPADPGDPETWRGPLSGVPVDDLDGDGNGNYALETR